MKLLGALLALLMPWSIRRRFLEIAFGFDLHRDSHIGFSIILPRRLIMEKGSRIGHLNVCKGAELLHLSAYASIANLNWITGFPLGDSPHFSQDTKRAPELLLKPHAAISSRHLIDCTATVTIGAHSIVGGFHSQILTHSVDLHAARQSSAPIEIGDYCFLGTRCVLLGDSVLPHHSILGANSLLQRRWSDPYQLYAGSPATPIKPLSSEMGFFKRETGFIW